eukprot:1143617-Pelagomonas_calceolata.AAC.1
MRPHKEPHAFHHHLTNAQTLSLCTLPNEPSASSSRTVMVSQSLLCLKSCTRTTTTSQNTRNLLSLNRTSPGPPVSQDRDVLIVAVPHVLHVYYHRLTKCTYSPYTLPEEPCVLPPPHKVHLLSAHFARGAPCTTTASQNALTLCTICQRSLVYYHRLTKCTYPLYTLPNEPSASSSRTVISSSLLFLTSDIEALAEAIRSAHKHTDTHASLWNRRHAPR